MLKAAGHAYSREELERMKRCDIQKLCKDYGVRANMKTEALIELLLDTIHNSGMSLLVPPAPPPAPTAPTVIQRRISTRSRTTSRASSARTRGTSGSSVIVHDEPRAKALVPTSSQATIPEQSTSRSRKAKDTQLRLGVGRPTVAGGPGPRAVTRSTSLSKPKRGKISRSVKPMEETIEEEPENNESPQQETPVETPLAAGPSSESSSPNLDIFRRLDVLEALLTEADITQRLNLLKDVPEEIKKIKRSLTDREAEMTKLRTDVDMCRKELAIIRGDSSRITFLEGQLRMIKENVAQAFAVADALLPASSSTGSQKGGPSRRVSIPLANNNMNTGQVQGPLSPMKTPPATRSAVEVPTTLGKRQRVEQDSSADSPEGEIRSERALGKIPARPSKKKAKLVDDIDPTTNSESHTSSEQPKGISSDSAGSSAASSVAGVGTPPPTAHLPELFTESYEATQDGDGKATTDLLNNDTTPDFGSDGFFNFNFQAVTSTPRDDAFGYYDSTPFSPGSAARLRVGKRGPSGTESSQTNQPSAFGYRRPTTMRARSPGRMISTGFELNQYMNLESIPYTIDGNVGPAIRREATASGIPSAVPVAMGGVALDDSPIRNTHRTMYGTEQQNDTRFGDFGRTGIASTSDANFWMNGGLF